MELKRSNYIEFIEPYTSVGDQVLKVIFLFPSYSLDQLEYSKLSQRWDNRDVLINNLSQKLQSGDTDWFEIVNNGEDKLPFLKKNEDFDLVIAKDILSTKGYRKEINNILECRDLRGLYIKDLHLNKNSKNIFSSTIFDYCIIDNCSFEEMWFTGSEFNHVWFFDTKFINCKLICSISSSLFCSCSFENTTINNKFNFSFFSKNLFFNCKLNLSLIEIDTREFAFVGSDKIKLINYDYPTIGFDKSGEKVLKVLKTELSKNLYKDIRLEIYKDFKAYFIELNKIYTENYTHEKFLKSYYAYSLYDNISKGRYKLNLRYLFGRYVFAYGLKWQQPLKALGWLIIISSFVFLFSGVSFNGVYINRNFDFNINETINTLKDFIYCLYLSFCSVLNIGLNIGTNTLGIDVFRSVLSFIGVILITIFTLNLVRRYIK